MKKTVYMKDCKAQFHPTFGNGKLGRNIMGVSYVPADDQLTLKDGTLVTDCKGTCTNCKACKVRCYAVRTFKQYNGVTINRVENTMQLREDIKGHFQAIENAIVDNGVKIVRYTESGYYVNIPFPYKIGKKRVYVAF